MALIVTVELLVLVSVTVWGRPEVPTYWLGKEMDGGDKLTAGIIAALPLSDTVCGLPIALSEMLMTAVNVACEGGVKDTVIRQVPPTERDAPQLFVSAKALAPLPLINNEEIARAALPLFVTVTACGALVVPTAWFEKVRLAGETATVDPMPVPVRVTTCGLVDALS
jgi:hypothetical protein